MKSNHFRLGLIVIAVVALGALTQFKAPSAFAPRSESFASAGIQLVTESIEKEIASDLSATLRYDFGTGGRLKRESVDPVRESDALVPNRKTNTVIVIASPAPQPAVGAPNATKPTTAVASNVKPPATFFDSKALFIHVPPDAANRPALRIVVALHGMNGQGEAFASSLLAEADKNGWVVIAPTIAYQNYLDTGLLTNDDLLYARELKATLDELPKRLAGYRLSKRASLYGFSRGAQFAHRFALMYPDRVLGVAAMSAGAYTLPYENRSQDGKTALLPFPFGVGDFKQRLGQGPNYTDLKRVKFLVQVGASDNHEGDVARSFDAFIGKTRVDRATSFVAALKELGITARLVVIPGTGHECSTDMQKNSYRFLQETSVDPANAD
jgi:pimeloyl-ACP methyl ester carboxylesterase